MEEEKEYTEYQQAAFQAVLSGDTVAIHSLGMYDYSDLLKYALEDGDTDLIRIATEYAGVDVFLHAIRRGYINVAEHLLGTLPEFDLHTVVDVATQGGEMELILFLIEHGIDSDILSKALAIGNPVAGFTTVDVLVHAVRMGYVGIGEYMIQLIPEFDLTMITEEASRVGEMGVVSFLLERDIGNLYDMLRIAIESNQLPLVRYFAAQFGGEMDQMTLFELVADVCIQHGRYDMVRALVPTALSNEGLIEDCIEEAIFADHEEIVIYLRAILRPYDLNLVTHSGLSKP